MAEDITLKHKANGITSFVVVNSRFGIVTAGISSHNDVNSVNSSKAIKLYSGTMTACIGSEHRISKTAYSLVF